MEAAGDPRGPVADGGDGFAVIAGVGAFVMTAESRADFARALRAKLVREIA